VPELRVVDDRHAIRFATYAGLAVSLGSRRTWPKLLVVAGAIVYAGPQIRRARARLRDPGERAAAVGAVPATVAFIDLAKMAGYIAGLADRLRGRCWAPGRLRQPRS
jgi:hypothetical protein